MLADLRLSELPYEALVALKHAVDAEVRGRKTAAKGQAYQLTRRLAAAARSPLPNGGPGPRCLPEDVQALPPFPLPDEIRQVRLSKRLSFLPHLLAQDWTACFPTAGQDARQCYVYAHVDPRQSPLDLRYLNVTLQGQPFYIGKGSGARAWNLKRNEGHGKRLRALRALDYPPTAIVQLIAEHLTEQEALCLEAKLIYFFGSIYDTTVKGCLVNLADHMRPAFLATPPLPLPLRPPPTPPLRREQKHQWDNLQNTPLARKHLPPELLHQGYVLLYVPPQMRDAFVVVARLFKYGRPGSTQGLTPLLYPKWRAWLTLTERLAEKCQQRATSRPDFFPV